MLLAPNSPAKVQYKKDKNKESQPGPDYAWISKVHVKGNQDPLECYFNSNPKKRIYEILSRPASTLTEKHLHLGTQW